MSKLPIRFASVKFSTLLIAVVLLVGVIGFSGCAKSSKSKELEVDLNEYITLDIQGKDTQGVATLTFDSELLLEDLLDDPDRGEYFEDEERKLTNLIESITVELSDTYELTNGDVLSYDIEYDEDRAEDLEIVFADLEDVTVEGLAVPTEYNPFDDVTLTFSGVSPFVEVKVEFNCSLDTSLYVTFSTDKELYARGETVILTADYDEYDAEENSFVIVTQTEKEYVAEAEYEYILEASQLVDKTDLFDYIYGEVQDFVTTELSAHAESFYIGLDMFDVYGYGGNYYTGELAGDIIVESAYLLTQKMDQVNSFDDINELSFVIKVPIIFTEIDATTVYYAYIFATLPDLQLDADGNIFVAYSDLYIGSKYKTTQIATYDYLVTDNVNDYEIAEIPVTDIPVFPSLSAAADPATETTTETTAGETTVAP
jgi:hypothetical protein